LNQKPNSLFGGKLEIVQLYPKEIQLNKTLPKKLIIDPFWLFPITFTSIKKSLAIKLLGSFLIKFIDRHLVDSSITC